MKKLVIVLLLAWASGAQGQDATGFAQVISSVRELALADSIRIASEMETTSRLDTQTVKQWFSPLLGSTTNNRLKNRNYFLTGKITTHPNFNVLFILEEKKKTDSLSSQVVYLITTKKDGTWIAAMQAAVGGSKKKSTYNTSAWIYKDYKVVLDSRMVINEKEYADLSNYKINGTGRFVLYPK